MPYFSRLSDIVTCNLTVILQQTDQPEVALEQIVLEMQEGLAGGQRSVKNAAENVARIQGEIHEQAAEIDRLVGEARAHLAAGRDDRARQSLLRKSEVQDLMAGLEQQHQAAIATRDHLTTTLHALEARLSDARRRLASLRSGGGAGEIADAVSSGTSISSRNHRLEEVERELEALRQEGRAE